ncbi:hypothetical protein VTO42DRAFT_7385 [Malbranchea cinnamomea]
MRGPPRSDRPSYPSVRPPAHPSTTAPRVQLVVQNPFAGRRYSDDHKALKPASHRGKGQYALSAPGSVSVQFQTRRGIRDTIRTACRMQVMFLCAMRVADAQAAGTAHRIAGWSCACYDVLLSSSKEFIIIVAA